MIKKIFLRCCLLMAAFFVSACGKIHFVEFEPIYIKANAKGANIYRAAYPKDIDILHTQLDISFNWDSSLVYGKASISATPYAYPLDTLKLDAKGFTIHRLFLSNSGERRMTGYSYQNNKISIVLDKTYQPGEQIEVFIDYTAAPQKLKVGSDISSRDDRGLYFINPKGKGKKPVQLWTQGETENNSCWFPTVENPAEKMTHQINITVDDRFQTISNGMLTRSEKHGNGTRTDHWSMEKEHAVYLTMMAVGEFAVTEDKWKEVELRYLMEPEFAPYAQTIFGRTPEMIDFFSETLDYPYPWPKYDQVVVRDFVSGAMENTTASVFYEGLNQTAAQNADKNQDDIIAHELFHHWFGDLVTCESWANLPLNEAFATYGEYLWKAHREGKASADFHLLEDAKIYFDYAKNRDADVIRFDYADKEQMFDPISYQKGALILHALRNLVGDAAFFRSLNLYLTRHAYKTAEIHDLRLVFEDITGKDLNWFFNQWFLNKGFPELKIEKTYEPVARQLQVKISQVQDSSKAPAYLLPLTLKWFQADSLQSQNIQLDQKEQTFTFDDAESPYFWIETENLLIKIQEETNSNEQYMRFLHASNFFTRYRAARYFNMHKNEPPAPEVFRKALFSEEWPVTYIGLLHFQPSQNREKELERLRELALNAPNSTLRAEAIAALKKHFKGKASRRIFQEARTDISEKVQKALRKGGL